MGATVTVTIDLVTPSGVWPVVNGEVTEPRSGAWTAAVGVDLDPERGESPPAAGDPVTLRFATAAGDRADFVGTVVRGDFTAGAGHWAGRVVAGAGALGVEIPARYYSDLSVGDLATDILSGVGENLDTVASDDGITGRSLPLWSRSIGPARAALQAVAAEVGATWRVSRAGFVVMVPEREAFPELDPGDVDVTAVDPSGTAYEVAPYGLPLLRPGVTWDARRVVQVVTEWSGGRIAQRIRVAGAAGAAPETTERGASQVAQAVQRASERSATYAAWYPAKVVSQDGEHLEVQPLDTDRLAAGGLTRVPLRHGLPGFAVEVTPGALVRVFFERSSPTSPAAALWPDGSSVKSITFIATDALTIDAPEISITGTVELDGDLTATGQVISKAAGPAIALHDHIHGTPMGPTQGTMPTGGA